MKISKRLPAALCCVSLCAALAAPAAAAEGTLDCGYKTITQDGFAACSMDGVDALYNLDGPTLYCVELIERYYLQVYGLELRCSDGSVTVLNNSDLYFAPTEDPQPGDVLFGSAASRGTGSSHWAMVKRNNGDSLTLFEQNWRWNGQAGVDRVIEFPTDAYEAYTLQSRSGAAIRPVANAETAPSSWAVDYAERAAASGIASLRTDYQAAVTREDFCQMLLNLLERRGVEIPNARTACAAAAALELTDGQNGDRSLQREEAAVIAVRVAARIGELPAVDRSALAFYADAGDISEWALDAVAVMTACDLMSGAHGAFRPQGTMTNEQAVCLLVRLDEGLAPAVTYGAAAGGDSVAATVAAGCAAARLMALGATDLLLRIPLSR